MEVLQYRAESPGHASRRRWALPAVCLLCSVVLDVGVAAMFAAPGATGTAMRGLLGTFALGPFAAFRLGTGGPVRIGGACAAIILICCYPAFRNAPGVVGTIAGFALWYYLAWDVLVQGL